VRSLLALCALTFVACVEDTTTRPCTEDERCLPGFVCVEGSCEACAIDECPTAQITLVTASGGLACGPDGTCANFSRGSLANLTEVEVARLDADVTLVTSTAVSKMYAVRPAGIELFAPVEVVLPVSRRLELGARVTILHALSTSGPWTVLPTVRDATSARATTAQLGLFVLTRDEPTDAGM
jgi:hypothetical protein